MGEAWQGIWGKRSVEGSDLPTLMAADGFDTLGACSEDAWRAYTRRVATTLGIADGDSLLEVGCGAGAFLLPFAERGHPVAGVDYAPNLVAAARAAMPAGRFTAAPAHALPEGGHDFVVSNGVFLYFPDLDYAAQVLAAMAARARTGLAVLEVPDKATEAQSLAARRGKLGAQEYAARYAGLDHLYFDRGWFAQALPGWDVTVESQAIEGYMHSPFRFNVFARRHR